MHGLKWGAWLEVEVLYGSSKVSIKLNIPRMPSHCTHSATDSLFFLLPITLLPHEAKKFSHIHYTSTSITTCLKFSFFFSNWGSY